MGTYFIATNPGNQRHTVDHKQVKTKWFRACSGGNACWVNARVTLSLQALLSLALTRVTRQSPWTHSAWNRQRNCSTLSFSTHVTCWLKATKHISCLVQVQKLINIKSGPLLSQEITAHLRCLVLTGRASNYRGFMAVTDLRKGQIDHGSSVTSPKILGGKMFDFRRITLICLGYLLSKHKITICYKKFGGPWPVDPLATPVYHGLWPRGFGTPRNSFLWRLIINFNFEKLRRGITSQFTVFRKEWKYKRLEQSRKYFLARP